MSSAPNRRGLGRGLEVLVGGLEPNATELLELPIDAIHANPKQPRKRFDGEAGSGLAESVRSQGVDNVSHGCVNLSPAHAEAYFNLIRYGDLVTVTGTNRGPTDLLQSGDPGMADWNLTWAQYTAGSALSGAITTQPLTTA